MLKTEQHEPHEWGFVTGMFVGAAMGAAVALLLAPKQGKELRGDLADAAAGVGGAVSNGVNRLGETVSHLAGRGRAAVDDARASLGESVETLADAGAAILETGAGSASRAAAALRHEARVDH